MMRSGSDPERLKDMYAGLTLMWNLQTTHPGNLRGNCLHLLKMRGVFRNLISREYGPGQSIPDKPIVRSLMLSKEEIDKVEWR